MQRQDGQGLRFGGQHAFAHWDVGRRVGYQLCRAHGRPAAQLVMLGLRTEQITGDFGQEKLHSQRVSTDVRGFPQSTMAASTSPGSASCTPQ